LDDRATIIVYLNSVWKNACSTQISFQVTKFIFATELLKQPDTLGGYEGRSEWRPSAFGNVRGDHDSFVNMHEKYFQRI
jgi:hypothetical protein